MQEAYFDNSATTALCENAKTAMIEAFEFYGNASSLHSLGTKSAEILENARNTIAKQLSALNNEIYFTSGGTESDNIAVLGAANALKRTGRKIVTTSIEHSAIINTMKHLETQGFNVVYLKPDESGSVPISAFLDEIDKETILVSCMSVNNETGAFLPIDKIKKAIIRKGSPALFHCDATQSFMKYSYIPKKFGIDIMTVSAHKIHGPKGIGAIYVKKGVRILPHTFGGEQESGLRPGTESLILINGFSAAVKDFGNAEENRKKCGEIKQYIIDNLKDCDYIRINSPKNSSEYILNISVLGIRSETMLHFLENKNIFVSSGSACAKGKPSHVLSSLGFSNKRADSAIRISFSKFNDISQADLLIEGIKEAEKTLIKSK